MANAVRIGLVDDDISVRRSVGRLLTTYGYSCSAYESGEAALADPEFLKMDCLVVDVQLGGINGFELCERIQGLGSQIPHIFITAYTEDNFPEWPLRLHDDIVLIKPFQENQLIESIVRSLEHSG